ncbi:MAG: 50S ribosomal protein L9 [Acidimicrobiia bacterium]
MKLILIKDVEDLGTKGEVVDVAPGYARNYLIPRTLAIKATAGALGQAEALRKARVEAERRAMADAEQLATSLVGSRIVVAARAGDEGRLFGSIGPRDIVEAIRKFTGVEVERAVIVQPAPIRDIGLHEVTLRPHAEIEFQVTLDVIPA